MEEKEKENINFVLFLFVNMLGGLFVWNLLREECIYVVCV